MTYHLEAARAALERAESELQRVMISAIEARSYGEISSVNDVSAKLRDLIETLPPHETSPANVSPTRHDHVTLESHRKQSRPKNTAHQSGSLQATEPGTRRDSHLDYPRFLVRDNQLVKLGWSGSNKREYEHRVPKDGLDAFIKYLSRLTPARFPITAEAVAKALQKDETQRILGYQVYVVAAWLRSIDLLRAEGRQGYFIPKGVDLAESTNAAWEELAQSGNHT